MIRTQEHLFRDNYENRSDMQTLKNLGCWLLMLETNLGQASVMGRDGIEYAQLWTADDIQLSWLSVAPTSAYID